MKPLNGRRILFIGIGFYDYEDSIVERLCSMGANVTAFVERPALLREGLLVRLFHVLPRCADFLQQRHERAILARTADIGFDQVLVIKGSGLSVWFLNALRSLQPGAEFILYQWDSLARVTGIRERLPFFDRVLTFDRHDVLANSTFQFRPLFYRETNVFHSTKQTIQMIDISFVGQLHSDRLRAIREVEVSARVNGLTAFVYLRTGILTWIRLFLRGDAHGVHVRPIAYRTVTDIIRRTRCVLDLPHDAQSGLTMRAIEAIGMGKMLITTARDIEFYDFYLPTNIRIVISDQFEVDPSFILGPAVPIPDCVRQRYTLDAWIQDVFGLSKKTISNLDSNATLVSHV